MRKGLEKGNEIGRKGVRTTLFSNLGYTETDGQAGEETMSSHEIPMNVARAQLRPTSTGLTYNTIRVNHI